MNASIEKQILEWKEELSKQIKTRDHARKVFEEAINNINALQGGIQFGELLLNNSEPTNQPSSTVELGTPQRKMSSKSKGSLT